MNDFLFASIHEVVKTLVEAFNLGIHRGIRVPAGFAFNAIPTIAIPVALIGTFFAFVSYRIQFEPCLTLCALVLAIAIVVDDAIVVVEGVHAKLDQGYTSSQKGFN